MKKRLVKKGTIFLSGNDPLVIVLREALARDRKHKADELNEKNEQSKNFSISDARREVKPSIQNVHHFRNDYLKSNHAPDERVAVFDEGSASVECSSNFQVCQREARHA